MRSSILPLIVLVLVGAVYSQMVGTIDSTEQFSSVGLSFKGHVSGIMCDPLYLPVFYTTCTASLLDSDDLLTHLGGFTSTDKTLLRRRLLTIPAQCVWSNGQAPIDDPAAPSYIIFKYDAINSPGLKNYQQLTEQLGFEPCGIPVINTTFSKLLTASGYTTYRYRTLGIGTFASNLPLANVALLMTDIPVPNSIVPDNELMRIPDTTYLSPTPFPAAVLVSGFPEAHTELANTVRVREYLALRVAGTSPVAILTAGVSDYGTEFDSYCATSIGGPALDPTNFTLGNYNMLGMIVSGPADAFAKCSSPWIVRIGTPHWRLWAKTVLLAYLDAGIAIAQQVQITYVNDSFVISPPDAPAITIPSPRAPESISNFSLGLVLSGILLGLFVLMFILVGIILSCGSYTPPPKVSRD